MVAPGSRHASGGEYMFLAGCGPDDIELTDPPPWLLDLVIAKKSAARTAEKVADEISDGARNNTLTSLAGTMQRRGMSKAAILAALRAENAVRCKPRLPESELHHIVESVGRYEPEGGPELEAAMSVEDFYAYLPMHSYIFTPTREMWPASSVNAKIPPVGEGENAVKASAWIDSNRSVEQMTWAPGEPLIITGHLISHGGWIPRPGARTFNLYRPPWVLPGDANDAEPWLSLLRTLYPEEWEHIRYWMAHRVQKPHEKINHALVIGGKQGIGKETLLEPLKHAVGPWNFADVSPTQMLGRFNSFLKSVVLRVSEIHDLGEVDRFGFYEHMKVFTAAPPDVLRCDEKNIREHYVFNACGIVMTTNHRAHGLYLPPDDRRHFVAWSETEVRRIFAHGLLAADLRLVRQGGMRQRRRLSRRRRSLDMGPESTTAEDTGLLECRRREPRPGRRRVRHRSRRSRQPRGRQNRRHHRQNLRPELRRLVEGSPQRRQDSAPLRSRRVPRRPQ